MTDPKEEEKYLLTQEWPDFTKPQITEEQLAALMAPLNPARVKQRSQGGGSVSYLEAWDIKATLIRVFGFGGFSADVIDSRIVQIREHATHPQHVKRNGEPQTAQAIAQATVRLHIPSLGCTYTETAAGAEFSSDIGEAVDNALKTAESDALKRCATYLGTQFGLSLYDKGSSGEVVRTIIEPTQAAMLAKIREQRAAKVSAEAEAALAQALGAKKTEDADAVPVDNH